MGSNLNKNLHAAKKVKNDEFYTKLSDVENELRHYKAHFKDKVVYCNCDDPAWSSFYKYFTLNFKHLGLKKVITTHYSKDPRPQTPDPRPQTPDPRPQTTPTWKNASWARTEVFKLLEQH